MLFSFLLRDDALLRKGKLFDSIFDFFFEQSQECLVGDSQTLTSYLTLHAAFAFRNAGLRTAPPGTLHLVMLS